MEFKPEEKRLLQQIGRTEIGRDLCVLLKRAKTHYESITGIDTSKDAAAQIEGRKLFGSFIDNIIQTIETKERQIRPRDVDNYE